MFECGVKRKKGSEELHYQYVIPEGKLKCL